MGETHIPHHPAKAITPPQRRQLALEALAGVVTVSRFVLIASGRSFVRWPTNVTTCWPLPSNSAAGIFRWPNQELFGEAIVWLGKQFGLK